MRTESEIKNLPLEERQKLAIELRQVKTSDKAYANAKAIIGICTSVKGWKEPRQISVENITDHEVTIDEQKVAAGATAKVYVWQFHALARFLKPEDGFQEELEEAGAEGVKSDAAAAEKTKAGEMNIANAVKEGIAQGMAAIAEATKKAVALLLFVFLLTLGFKSTAQTLDTGDKSGYTVYHIADLAGGTANMVSGMKTNYNVPLVTTVTNVFPNWTSINGVPTNSPTTNIVSTTNYQGVISIAKWTDFTLTVSGAAMLGSTNVNIPIGWDYSDLGVNWQTNRWLTPLTLIATGQVTTNLDVSGVSGGFIRLGSWDNSLNAGPLTNLAARVQFKFPRN